MSFFLCCMQEAGSRAREASEQLEQAQARSEALERQLAQESELRSTAEQRAADEEATRAALEADAGAQGTKVKNSVRWLAYITGAILQPRLITLVLMQSH